MEVVDSMVRRHINLCANKKPSGWMETSKNYIAHDLSFGTPTKLDSEIRWKLL